MDEADAIERLQHGDIGGLEYLVRRYQAQAVRTAYLVTHDPALAQDVAQAAFLNAYERIARFDPGRPFAPWFLTSVLRAAVKAARERERHLSYDALTGGEAGDEPALRPDVALLSGQLPDRRPGPEALGEQAETGREIWAALEKLSPEQRAAVIARYYLGMSEAEAAAALSAPLSTVKWRLHAARQRLRLLLGAAATH